MASRNWRLNLLGPRASSWLEHGTSRRPESSRSDFHPRTSRGLRRFARRGAISSSATRTEEAPRFPAIQGETSLPFSCARSPVTSALPSKILSNTNSPRSRLMTDNGPSSTGCLTTSKASSLLPNGPNWPNAHRIQPCGTLTIW